MKNNNYFAVFMSKRTTNWLYFYEIDTTNNSCIEVANMARL